VTFGIDVRWAGVCAAALVVVIMAASILDEGPVPSIVLPTAREAAEPESVRARLLEKSLADKEGAPAKSDRRPAARSNASPPAARPEADASPAELGRRQLAVANEVAQERGFAAAAPEAPADSVAAAAPPPAPAADEKRRDAPSREKDALAPRRDEQKKPAVAQAPRSAVSADAAGGEAGAASGAYAPSEAGESVRVLASAADGLGSAPEVERASGGAGLAAFRGREFILLVESSGRVRSAVPIAPGAKLGDLRVKTKSEGEDLSPVLALRFAASDRARRLRVRLE
jgi:hypothetical protein